MGRFAGGEDEPDGGVRRRFPLQRTEHAAHRRVAAGVAVLAFQCRVNDDAGDALIEPGGDLVAPRRQAGNRGAGPPRAGQRAGDGLVIRQRPFVGQPATVNRQGPERRCAAPAHQPTPRNIPVGVTLTHPHQSLSLVMHFEFPPAHRPSGEKAGKATDATLKIPKCPLLLLSHWIHYADQQMAPICRSLTGSITPIMRWLLYADPQLAPICRSLTGQPVRNAHRFPAGAEIGVRNDVASLRLRDVTPGG
ncbi:MAG: hypothetical protein IPJ52_12295 [Rhodocyclaceae bacterium]|nr:hypothetical protein [Rhodocyclaceae bacterium]